MASNPGTPLLDGADHAILLATPPEVIAGSTRMNAGTAQKCAINMLSTLIGIRLGHAYDGLMVNVAADNEKLRGRAAGIVARAAGIPAGAGARLLAASGRGSQGGDPDGRRREGSCRGAGHLASHGRDVRASLALLSAKQGDKAG